MSYNEDYYKPHHGSFTQTYDWEHEKEACLRKANSLKRLGRSALDIGCGRGFLVRALREVGVDAWGIESSKWAVANADNNVREKISYGEAHKLPIWTQQFDFGVVDSVMEHLTVVEIEKVLIQAYSRIREWLVVSTPISLDAENRPWGDPTHVTTKHPAWWASRGWYTGWLLDLELSVVSYEEPFQHAVMAFRKGTTPTQTGKLDWPIRYRGIHPDELAPGKYMIRCVECNKPIKVGLGEKKTDKGWNCGPCVTSKER